MALKKRRSSDDDPRIVPAVAACYDCGGKCLLKVHVKNGVIIRAETDEGEEPQLRACLQGRGRRASRRGASARLPGASPILGKLRTPAMRKGHGSTPLRF